MGLGGCGFGVGFSVGGEGVGLGCGFGVGFSTGGGFEGGEGVG